MFFTMQFFTMQRIFHCYQASWFLQICQNTMPVMLKKSAFTVMSDTNLPVVIFHIS